MVFSVEVLLPDCPAAATGIFAVFADAQSELFAPIAELQLEFCLAAFVAADIYEFRTSENES